MSKVVIPKGLDIEEIVERDEIEREKATRREEFLNSIRYLRPLSEEEKRHINIKVANYSQRRDAQDIEARRRAEYLAVVGKQLDEEGR